MSAASNDVSPSRSWRRWIVALVLLAFFGVVLWKVINPYRGQRFEKVPHGSHVHYVPRDRNPDAPISRFPTEKPAEDERITPEGQVVPLRSSDATP